MSSTSRPHPKPAESDSPVWRGGAWHSFFFQLSSVQLLFANPWTVAHQASLSITNSQNLLKLMPIELVMPSKHLILCHPLLLLPSIFYSIRIFSSESVLCIRWPKYWSFSFSISSFNEYSGLISFSFFFFFNIYLFIWLPQVLVAACKIFSLSLQSSGLF